jgi:hypothetical protein
MQVADGERVEPAGFGERRRGAVRIELPALSGALLREAR